MGSDSPSILAPIKPLQTQEDDPPNPTEALLSFSTDSPSSKDPSRKFTTTTIVFISLLLVTCVALAVAGAFAFLFFSASNTTIRTKSAADSEKLARPLKKLDHPVVLLISSDGFRFGYQFKTPTPNIGRLIANGTEAELGLIPVFPTLTFPNHYSIVTGLYPAYHGIINNHFADPNSGDYFTMASHEPKWWLGEPLWETVANHGLKAALYFWPGSEVQAAVAETEQPKWWERNAPNMVDIHSTQEFLSTLGEAGDRLVIVEFYGTWCASCRALFPKLCRTAEDHPEILFLKVNFDENKPMCKSLNVKVLPYFHFYRGADGQLESFSCSLAKFQKIKDAIATHNTARCSIGPPKGVGDILLPAVVAPKDKSTESPSA